MFKLSFNDPEWITNGPAIICRIDSYIILPEFNDSLFRILEKRFPLAKVSRYDDSIHFVSTGVAKCHPNDNFTQVLGERISESKAKLKAYNWGTRVALVISEYYNNLYCSSESMEFQMDRLIEHEEEHIKYLEGLTDTPV